MNCPLTSEARQILTSFCIYDVPRSNWSFNPGGLGGGLTVNLEDGFLPSATDSFVIIAGNVGISGSFDNVPNGETLTTIGGEGTFRVDSGGIGGNSIFDEVMLSNFVPTIFGDFNGDGVVNLLDVSHFVNALSTGTYILEADINRDGVVNLLDVTPFIDLLSG